MIGIVLVRVNFFIFYFYIWREREGVEEKRHLKSLGFGHQTVKPIPSSRYTTERTSFRRKCLEMLTDVIGLKSYKLYLGKKKGKIMYLVYTLGLFGYRLLLKTENTVTK